MSGIDAATFKAIDGRDHLYQSVGILLSTGVGERVMREWVGAPGAQLLGANLQERTILFWWVVTWMVLDVYEPRLRNLRLIPLSVTKAGEFECIIAGDEALTAHLGYQQARLLVSIKDNTVTVTEAGQPAT